jgi:hypothetical protein
VGAAAALHETRHWRAPRSSRTSAPATRPSAKAITAAILSLPVRPAYICGYIYADAGRGRVHHRHGVRPATTSTPRKRRAYLCKTLPSKTG